MCLCLASLSCAHFFPFCLFFHLFHSLQYTGFAECSLFCFVFCSCHSVLLSILFCVTSVAPLCPVFSYSAFSLLASELQSPSTRLCVLNHGVKLTRNAGREHLREQSLAASHLLLVHSQLEQRKWKQHIPKRAENPWPVWVSF